MTEVSEAKLRCASVVSIDGLEDCNPVSRDDVEYSKFYRGIFPITAILVVQNGPFPKNK